MANINAELGAALATVMPHPRYRPLMPCCLHKETPLAQNVGLFPGPLFPTTAVTAVVVLVPDDNATVVSVCMRDLIVSAGKKPKM